MSDKKAMIHAIVQKFLSRAHAVFRAAATTCLRSLSWTLAACKSACAASGKRLSIAGRGLKAAGNRLARFLSTVSSHIRVVSIAAGQWLSVLADRVRQSVLVPFVSGLQKGRAGMRQRLGGLKRFLPGKGKRTIVGRVLLLQLLWAAIIYVLAVMALWWTSNQLIADNLHKQAIQWVAELDAQGTPLYVSRKGKKYFTEIEKRVRNFPEIAYLRYLDAKGDKVLGEYRSHKNVTIPAMDRVLLEGVSGLAATEQPYLFDEAGLAASTIRLVAPVRIRSIASDGLFGFKLDKKTNEQIKVIGYIDLGMDLAYFREHIKQRILVGSVVIAAMIMLSLLVGRFLLKRALLPLTRMEQPLARLAAGDIDVKVEGTGDAEIIAISNALNTTISALKERDQKLRMMANYDALTGLVNRAYFTHEVDREIGRVARHGSTSAILFIDLDLFKYVNDTLGHAAGDRLLVQVSELFKSRIREDDVLSRFGGDEFTILACEVTKTGAQELAKSLNQIMQNFQFTEKGQSFNIFCSIGIVMIDSDRFSTEELIAQADMACHMAKTSGRNRFHMYEFEDNDRNRMAAEISWSRLIKDALEEDRFRFFYQPIVNLEGEARDNYEVLLRLPGPDGELILPSVFLPAAERFGLMTNIDQWVIDHAFQMLAGLRGSGREVVFSINLSGQSLEHASLAAWIEDRFKRHHVPPSAVIFDITERTVVRRLEKIQETIESLMKLGCRFALDDFGAGFSSFGHLKSLPVHFIKIDRTIVENLESDVVNQTMVQSVSQIAKAMGKEVVAEYVRDPQTMALLKKYGVDYVQGDHTGAASPELLDRPVAGALRLVSQGGAGRKTRR